MPHVEGMHEIRFYIKITFFLFHLALGISGNFVYKKIERYNKSLEDKNRYKQN